MLNTPFGLKVIDWEDSGYRSAFYDFFCYLFYRTVSRGIPVEVVLSEIHEVLPLFISEVLEKAHPEFSAEFNDSIIVYRWIFYFEILARLIAREKTDRHLNIVGYIIQYLQAFEQVEESARSKGT